MPNPAVVAWVSLVLSLGAFALSLHLACRDRAKLVVKSDAWGAGEYGSAGMRITIVNAGRRPIGLSMLVLIAEDSKLWSGSYIGDETAGIKLGEGEKYELTLRKDDLLVGPDHDLIAADVQVEDSLQKRHRIKDAKKNIAVVLDS